PLAPVLRGEGPGVRGSLIALRLQVLHTQRWGGGGGWVALRLQVLHTHHPSPPPLSPEYRGEGGKDPATVQPLPAAPLAVALGCSIAAATRRRRTGTDRRLELRRTAGRGVSAPVRRTDDDATTLARPCRRHSGAGPGFGGAGAVLQPALHAAFPVFLLP